MGVLRLWWWRRRREEDCGVDGRCIAWVLKKGCWEFLMVDASLALDAPVGGGARGRSWISQNEKDQKRGSHRQGHRCCCCCCCCQDPSSVHLHHHLPPHQPVWSSITAAAAGTDYDGNMKTTSGRDEDRRGDGDKPQGSPGQRRGL